MERPEPQIHDVLEAHEKWSDVGAKAFYRSVGINHAGPDQGEPGTCAAWEPLLYSSTRDRALCMISVTKPDYS
nr:hypothetical protein CFP56_30927 [Quercus suber]